MTQARASKIYPRTLKQAIRDLMADPDYPPVVNNVRFLRRIPTSGETTEWNFASVGGDPTEGPVGNYKANSQNKVAAAIGWLESYRTDKDKGVIATWDCSLKDSTGEPGGIIFWEDPKPSSNSENIVNDAMSIGCFIVNGGECSPVIEFSPNAKWTFTSLHGAGGLTGGPMSATTKDNNDANDPNNPTNCCGKIAKGVGTTSGTPADETAKNTYGPASAATESQKSQAANKIAGQDLYTITAELRVQGMPNLGSQESWLGKTLSLVVINPFYLRNTNNTCGDWLAYPSCNPVYSNKAWRIDGISHSISEGQFVTSFKLFLAAPSIDLNSYDPLGGQGSQGWVPPRRCST